MLVSGARGSTRVSLYSFAFFPLDRQRREPAPPRLLRRRKSLRPPVAPCQAPTVVALEAVPTVDEDGAAWWPNAPVLADSSSNAEQAEPRRAEPELQDHGAATHGDARSLSAQNHRVSYALHNLSLHPPNAALALPNRPFRAPRANTLSAALARGCSAARSDMFGLRRSRVNANSLYSRTLARCCAAPATHGALPAVEVRKSLARSHASRAPRSSCRSRRCHRWRTGAARGPWRFGQNHRQEPTKHGTSPSIFNAV